MSKNTEISEFDQFIRQSLDGAKVPAPQGVWEGISAAGSAAGTASQAGWLAKLGGIKTVAISSGIAVVATVTALVVSNDKDKPATELPKEQKVVLSEKQPQTAEAENTISYPTEPSTNISPEGDNGNQVETSQSGVPSAQNAEFNPGDQGNNNDHSTTETRQDPTGNKAGDKEDNEHVSAPLDFSINKTWICRNGSCEARINQNPNALDYYWIVDGVKIYGKEKLTIKPEGAGNLQISLVSFPGGKRSTTSKTLEVIETKASVTSRKVQTGLYQFSTTTSFKSYKWEFGQTGHHSSEASPRQYFDYQNQAHCKVVLWTVNSKGCKDSVHARISFIEPPKFSNTFTPYDKDGFNDRFVIPIEHETKYHLIVVNGRGERVFESTDKHDTWDGTDMNTGKMEPAGKYTYRLMYQQIGSGQKMKQGTVLILK